MKLKPIVLVIPGAHLTDKDEVELLEDWIEFGIYEMHKYPDEEIASFMKKSVNTIRHYRTDLRREIGSDNALDQARFFSTHGLVEKENGRWKWIAIWKKSPYLLKAPLHRKPKRPLK